MKRVGSVWMAAARNLWWKLLVIIAVLCAAEIGLYHWSARSIQMEYDGFAIESLRSIAERGRLKLVFFAAVVALMACCSLQGSRFGGKNLYTLQRLPMAEWQVTLHWALVHLACFVILWAVQVGMVLVLWQVYAAEFSPASPSLDLLVTVYTTPLFHAVLPMADRTRWIYLLTYGLSMSVLTATFGFFQRRGRYRIGLLIMLGCYFTLTQGMGTFSTDLLMSALCLVLVAIDGYAIWEVYHETQTN